MIFDTQNAEMRERHGAADATFRPALMNSEDAIGKALFSTTIASYFLAAFALIAVLKLGLLPAVLAALLVFNLVDLAAPAINRVGLRHRLAEAVALVSLVVVIVVLIALALVGTMSVLSEGPDGLAQLLRKMAEAVDRIRHYLPLWAQDYIPATLEDLEQILADWLREHAKDIPELGRNVGTFLIHVLAGMIIGGMTIFQRARIGIHSRPLTSALANRVRTLSGAFRQIVFAQVRISFLNAVLTGAYLAIVLPSIGIHLPLVKTMVLVTFLTGLLPIIGSLLSNTMIVLISLQVSVTAAVMSLAFLVTIHKLEYFVNARIVSGRINARTWELLVALLVMEAAFGIQGLIAAPIYYAYLKNELVTLKLI